jgi:hypothetical protein
MSSRYASEYRDELTPSKDRSDDAVTIADMSPSLHLLDRLGSEAADV